MDTLKDKQLLEDMVEKGNMPWLPWTRRTACRNEAADTAGRRAPAPACLGAHSDDIEIGCGGTILDLLAPRRAARRHLVRALGHAGARASRPVPVPPPFWRARTRVEVDLQDFRDGYFP